MQWPKEEEQEEKTNNNLQNTTKNKISSNTNLTKTMGELRCSGKVNSSCSFSGTLVNLCFSSFFVVAW